MNQLMVVASSCQYPMGCHQLSLNHLVKPFDDQNLQPLAYLLDGRDSADSLRVLTLVDDAPYTQH